MSGVLHSHCLLQSWKVLQTLRGPDTATPEQTPGQSLSGAAISGSTRIHHSPETLGAQTRACHGLGDWGAEDMSDGSACSQQLSCGSPSWCTSPHSTSNKRQQSVYVTLIRNSLPEVLLDCSPVRLPLTSQMLCDLWSNTMHQKCCCCSHLTGKGSPICHLSVSLGCNTQFN